MVQLTTEVKCPKCGTKREINGTEERVRCSNKVKCGFRFYTQKNLVPFIGTDPGNNTDGEGNIYVDGLQTNILVGLDETSDFKRLMWLAIMGKSWRGTNKILDLKLKEKIKEIRNG